VYDKVQNKFELSLESLGPKTLKNVCSPLEVFNMVMPWREARSTSDRPDSRRIAVLPFTNVSLKPEDGYFADGMTDGLIFAVSQLREIRVIARTSAVNYPALTDGALVKKMKKGSGKSVAEIGRELGVGMLVEGTVRKAGSFAGFFTGWSGSETNVKEAACKAMGSKTC